jgi:hypothetical protein
VRLTTLQLDFEGGECSQGRAHVNIIELNSSYDLGFALSWLTIDERESRKDEKD